MVIALAAFIVIAVTKATYRHYDLPAGVKLTIGLAQPESQATNSDRVTCSRYKLTEADVRSMSHTYHSPNEITSRITYDWTPCTISGSIESGSGTFQWQANPGHILKTDWPDGKERVLLYVPPNPPPAPNPPPLFHRHLYKLPKEAVVTIKPAEIDKDADPREQTICKEVKLTDRKVRSLFYSYHSAEPGDVEFRYLTYRCRTSGTIVYQGHTYSWSANPGHTLGTDWPDGIDKLLVGTPTQIPSP